VILFNNEYTDALLINEDAICEWIENVVINENHNLGDLSFIFCADTYLLEINKKYLKHNFFTDVITFDYTENKIVAGDIFISIDRIKENSEKYSVTFNYELLRVIIHGVLHLLGFKDKDKEDKLLMTSKEDEYLKLYKNVE